MNTDQIRDEKHKKEGWGVTFTDSRDGWMVQNWTLSFKSCEDGKKQKRPKQKISSSLVMQEADKGSRKMDPSADWRAGSPE